MRYSLATRPRVLVFATSRAAQESVERWFARALIDRRLRHRVRWHYASRQCD